jgi:hypothetical protein
MNDITVNTLFIFQSNLRNVTDSSEVRTKRIESLKMAIDANQLTNSFCKKFFDNMDNLTTDEMKDITKTINHRIMDSPLKEQRIRCEQTLAFADRLTISNDTVWIHYYRWMLYLCCWKLYNHLDSIEMSTVANRAKEKYVRLMQLQLWKEKNHPDRMWIMWEFTFHCYRYYSSVDKESIDLAKKWIAEGNASVNGSTLSANEIKKSKTWIERSEIQLDVYELWKSWGEIGGNEQSKFCEEQMKKLISSVHYKLSAKEMQMIWVAFFIRLNGFVKSEVENNEQYEYCIEMLNRLDSIRFGKEENWIWCYRWIIYDCYSTLSYITKDANKRRQIADRMQRKYRQLVEVSNEIFDELNNPFRLNIIRHFTYLALHLYKDELVDCDCIPYLEAIKANVASQSRGSLTDFEHELTEWYLERIDKRV